MATDLGPDGDLRAHSSWLRRDSDPLVTRNPVGNRDIRSHLRELFTFTLFFAPRTIVELGVLGAHIANSVYIAFFRF